ncbi:hypothetical protein [uncultured Methanobrevibacter sp.]|uniref:hypothetical protein n=1 Tax=uncultured Methanobrevibacter sp. TaxID=253161 RepID=UPI0026275691|nr:hypothetical protein [uncultured Methanobrevibacter sp.]
MNGRDKCELLNEIRQKIALKNNIEFNIEECTFEGDCSGTCPKCESELEYLENELNKKQANGEKIELEGILPLEEMEPTELTCGDLFVPFGDFGPSKPFEEVEVILEEDSELFEHFGWGPNDYSHRFGQNIVRKFFYDVDEVEGDFDDS